MKAGHRLQQEHGDKSSLFSPSEFAESANWICCLLFCFRWAVVFPWKMPVFLTGLGNSLTWLLSPILEFLQYYGSALLSYICTSSWLFYLHSAVLPHLYTPHASEWPVSVQSRSLWLQKILSAGSELLENHWEVLPPRAAAGLCRLHRTGPITSSHPFICFTSCFMHILVLVGWVSATW